MRRAPHEGKKLCFLQLKATRFSAWHCSQRMPIVLEAKAAEVTAPPK
jgi:hypothetical protein